MKCPNCDCDLQLVMKIGEVIGGDNILQEYEYRTNECPKCNEGFSTLEQMGEKIKAIRKILNESKRIIHVSN